MSEGLTDALAVQTQSGATLGALVGESPVLLVFLRHFGCTFCRQTIEHIAALKDEFAARGVRPVFVHLGTESIAQAHFEYYGLSEVERVHDPKAVLYQNAAFGLRRTSAFSHFFNPKVLAAWFVKGVIYRHGFGMVQNDAEQMPGVFFLRDGVIVRRFVHKTIADVPDYLGMVGE
jgi:thiol-disulfide isomerase/thioredoxin